jgi:hypothetical protein
MNNFTLPYALYRLSLSLSFISVCLRARTLRRWTLVLHEMHDVQVQVKVQVKAMLNVRTGARARSRAGSINNLY